MPLKALPAFWLDNNFAKFAGESAAVLPLARSALLKWWQKVVFGFEHFYFDNYFDENEKSG